MDILRTLLEATEVSSPVWTGDNTIAYISSKTGDPQIYEMDIVAKKETQRSFLPDSIRSITFSRATGALYFAMGKGGNEREQIYRLAPGSTTHEDITKEPDARHFFGGVRPDGSVVFADNARVFQTFDICMADGATGKKRIVIKNDDNYNWPAPDALSPNGKYLLYNKLLGQNNNALWMADIDSGTAIRVPDDGVISAETDPAWMGDSSGFFYLTDRTGEFLTVAYYDVATGESSAFYAFDWDVERMAVSCDGKYLALTLNEDGYMNLKVLDIANKCEVNIPKPPKGVISYYQQMAWSPKGHRLLFTLESGKRLSNIWLLDMDLESIARLTDNLLPEEIEARLAEPMLCRFKSFDGLEVPYWLYVPAGMQAKNLPIDIEIHGGPEGQELPAFTPFIQYLVSQGIAVVAPNVRGSTGYGKTYTHLDDVEKRLDSVKDIDALVSHLIESGVADKDRLAVTGMSYGGFMTLSCVTRYPHLWACAVDTVGMYNLESFMENTAEYRRAHRGSEYGTLEHHRELLRKVSPIDKVDDITAPLMVIHGKNDPRVPVSEAEQVVKYLREKGLPVEFICYEDEGHGIAKLKNKLDCYPKTAVFIKKYLNIGK